MTYALEVDGLDKSFGAAAILRHVAFAVEAGSTTAIVGPSGCGKTTLLRLIAGFEKPDAGTIALAGRVVAGGGWTPAHRRSVGYVAQDGALFPHATVGANVGFGLPRRARTPARIAELLEMVSLDSSYASRRPDQLSGGQQQRVALARALAREPELMLLDEPFSALDAGLRANTRRIVADVLAKAAITTILVTHDQPEALSFADRVAVMSAGRLAQIGTPREIYSTPIDVPTAEFIGDAVVLSAHVDGGRARCALGDVAVASNGVHGSARVMLRPEQIEVTTDGAGVSGTVVDVDYLGSEMLLGIRLDTGDGEVPERVTVRRFGATALTPGDRVGIRVLGKAVAYDL
ncbi:MULTISPECIES: ABC transporter ATP-binding protein [Rhodococcus]|uniref:ABC-type quaternary amine transporter n=2 Tax=Rhodococcus opacus TaxID=37919 RepID=C1BD26_RHOOB|nr:MULTISPECIES: ABC transporter ATP-binding protein [Rhodococcus]EID81313.1 putative iron(III) ABC transporter ATP-binding protein [Rhodococcus opacus RKJ300 = JCM 13270]KAF0965085.1 Fe(3+) ions import ATP-binding protein FbpC 2 [Rhodococcus sp. T7]QQZ19253.1 ABC transporter ATP-binding protein [Rhodococcus sp. 21391]UOT08025.1 ABC transporter ATP-binding protein [Rhodococcus opacus]BAH55770.1 putative iron(III) ABC transporter ATP-binding protein [Rhodococcus opacus B4]